MTILTLVEAAGPGNPVKAARLGRRSSILYSGKPLSAVSRKGARDSGKPLSAVSRKDARDVNCSFPHCSPRCHMKNAPVRCLPYPFERRSLEGSGDALGRSWAVSGKRRKDCFKTDGQR